MKAIECQATHTAGLYGLRECGEDCKCAELKRAVWRGCNRSGDARIVVAVKRPDGIASDWISIHTAEITSPQQNGRRWSAYTLFGMARRIQEWTGTDRTGEASHTAPDFGRSSEARSGRGLKRKGSQAIGWLRTGSAWTSHTDSIRRVRSEVGQFSLEMAPEGIGWQRHRSVKDGIYTLSRFGAAEVGTAWVRTRGDRSGAVSTGYEVRASHWPGSDKSLAGNSARSFMNEQNENEVLRLPLWKNALEAMRESGLAHGQVWEAEFFEGHLKCTREDMKFGLSISEIRRELEKDGFYLSGRGQKGAQYVILPPECNADVMAQYQRAAIDALKRGVILGTNTRLDTLSDSDRRRHEGMLEKLATRAVLMQRSGQIAKAIKESNPKLLQK